MNRNDDTLRRSQALLAVYIALAVCVMAFIFCMSAQEGSDSSTLSDAIANLVLPIVLPNYDSLDPATQELRFDALTHVIRKLAHMFEYAVLAVLTTLASHQGARVKALADDRGEAAESWKLTLLGILIAAAYAASDEFHQLFVPGRAGLATDVLIDSAGACIGALATAAVLALRRRAGDSKQAR